MIWGYGWSKNPMILRINQYRKEIPLTLIFGSDTWMDISVGQEIKAIRPDCSVDVKVLLSIKFQKKRITKKFILS